MTEPLNSDALLDGARALSVDLAEKPSMPVAVFLQEASDLYTYASGPLVQDRLLGVGLDRRHIDGMPLKIERLRGLESLWTLGRERGRPEALKDLSVQALEAYRDLLAAVRYAFRHETELLAQVRALPEGTTQAQLIQGLHDVAVLIAANRPAFDRIGLEAGQEDAAKTLGTTLQQAQSQYQARELGDELLDLRDRAYGDLNGSVDEVRAAGLYAFRKEPDLLYRFRSQYFLQNGRRSRARAKDEAPAPTAPAPAKGPDAA